MEAVVVANLAAVILVAYGIETEDPYLHEGLALVGSLGKAICNFLLGHFKIFLKHEKKIII